MVKIEVNEKAENSTCLEYRKWNYYIKKLFNLVYVEKTFWHEKYESSLHVVKFWLYLRLLTLF